MHSHHTDPLEFEKRTITIRARDGYALSATHLSPEAPKGAILINSGTGVPQHVYWALAHDLAQHGWASITYDYRGVGSSAPSDPRTLRKATKYDWARLDMSAALYRLRREHPGLPIMVFGHSVGAQFYGLVEGMEHVRAVMSYGTAMGYWRTMRSPYRYKVALLWHVLIPGLTHTLGQFPSKALNLGELIPAGAALQWARWGRRKDYFAKDVQDFEGFKRFALPWLALRASDDDVATSINAQGFYACYPNAQIEERVLVPADLGLKALGHVAFFSRKNRAAWSIIPQWFEAHLTTSQDTD